MPYRRDADRGMQAVRDATTGERLVQATLEHRVITFVYQGHRRTAEPHMVGIHEAGEPIVLAYQTAGFSKSQDLPGWRIFITTELDDVQLTERQFLEPRSDFNPDSQSMVEIFARA